MGNTEQKDQQEIVKADNTPTLAEAVENEKLPVCVNAGIKFKLFAVHFAAAVQKDGESFQILLAPTEAAEDKGMTIGEIVDEIRGLMGGQAGGANPELDGMKTQLESSVDSMANKKDHPTFDPKSIKLYIRQAFVYYCKKDGKGTLEYAFSLQIDPSQMLKKMEVFELTDITVSVWKTNRKKVKERMKIFNIDQYLEEMA